MTRFPLTILRHDYQGKDLSRQDFSKHLPQFLNAVPKDDYPGIKPKPASMRKLIEAISMPTLDKDICEEYYNGFLAVGSWEFYYRAEGWWALLL